MDPRPDVLVHTGDVADHGLPEEYAEAVAGAVGVGGPAGRLPGQPRRPGAVRRRRSSTGAGASRRANRAHAVGGARFLMLDSLVDEVDGVRQDHGVLAPETLAWLDAELAGDARPTFVCLHHPPVEIGVGLMDPIRLDRRRDARRGARPSPPRRRHARRPRPHDGRLDVRRPAACSSAAAWSPRCRSTRRTMPLVWYDAAAQLRDPPAARRRPADHPLARGRRASGFGGSGCQR